MVSEFSYIWNTFIYAWYHEAFNGSVPIFITETGYPSNNQGMQFPWLIPSTDVGCIGEYAENQTAQAVAFEVMASQLAPLMPSVIVGFNLFWFDNPSTSDYLYHHNTVFNCSWTPKNKAAFEVIQQLYAVPVPVSPSPSDSGSSSLLNDGQIVAVVAGGFALVFSIGLVAKYWYAANKAAKEREGLLPGLEPGVLMT